jgi:hypothetical protein
MHKVSTIVLTAAFTTLLAAAPAFAADNTSGAPSSSTDRQQADQDFGKLSKDGMKAFRDIREARLAIFDGKTDAAKTEIGEAQAALQKAKSDDSIFTKAESELKTPAGMTLKSGKAASTQAVAWLPVGGAMALDEDYAASPSKAQGVAKADTQLKQGDRKSAMETLRLADIDVDFIAELAPLQTTLDGVDHAMQLADAGHFFQANQALKTVEDGVRFDDEAFVATPGHADSAKVGQ